MHEQGNESEDPYPADPDHSPQHITLQTQGKATISSVQIL